MRPHACTFALCGACAPSFPAAPSPASLSRFHQGLAHSFFGRWAGKTDACEECKESLLKCFSRPETLLCFFERFVLQDWFLSCHRKSPPCHIWGSFLHSANSFSIAHYSVVSLSHYFAPVCMPVFKISALIPELEAESLHLIVWFE